jgi:hypothetical protein
MNVRELIEELSNLDGDLEIIVSSDEEGNSFNNLYSVETATCYRGADGIELVHPDDRDNYDYDEDALEDVLVFN